MEAEERKLLLENNRMLHKLLRAQRLSQLSSVLRWVIVLAVSGAVYYYLQPYLEQILAAYDQITSQVSEVRNLLPNSPF